MTGTRVPSLVREENNLNNEKRDRSFCNLKKWLINFWILLSSTEQSFASGRKWLELHWLCIHQHPPAGGSPRLERCCSHFQNFYPENQSEEVGRVKEQENCQPGSIPVRDGNLGLLLARLQRDFELETKRKNRSSREASDPIRRKERFRKQRWVW